MSYQEEQFLKISDAIRVMQGGTTDLIAHTDFANQIRNIDRDSLPYKSTIALEDNAVVVEDSLDDALDEMAVYGASEQTVTEQGKNLFDINGEINDYYNGTIITDSTSNTIVDGNLRAVRNSSHTHSAGQKIFVGAGNTITASCKIAGYEENSASTITNWGAFVLYLDMGATTRRALIFSDTTLPDYFENQTVISITATAISDEIIIAFGRGGGTNYVDFTDIQLEISEIVTDYDPFIPDSPSPDYPSEIRSVGCDVTVQGKNFVNLYDCSVNANGVLGTVSGESQTVNFSGTAILGPSGSKFWSFYGGTYFSNYSQNAYANGSFYLNAGEYTLSFDIDIGGRITDRRVYVCSGLAGSLVSYHNYVMTSQTGHYELTFTVHKGYENVVLTYQEWGGVNIEDFVDTEISNIQIELGSEATDYEPYHEPTTIEIPTLYGVGDIKDVMYVDRAQERAWVERHIANDLLVDTALVDEQTGAILDTPVIEELDYTALPTFSGGTTIMIAPSDDSPTPVVSEVTLRTIADHVERAG